MLHLRLLNALHARLFRWGWGWRFGSFGAATSVVRPIGIEGAENIYLGRAVYVAPQSYLAARPLTGAADCRLEIRDGCSIGRFNHIYATRRVVMHERVLTANGVYISDNLHSYQDIGVAIMDQPIRQIGDVEIGAGSWLGHNACVLGVRIGRQCVVAANAVVTRDVPDFCVVAGAPAVIIKRFDSATGDWRPTSPDGEFRP